MVLIPDWQLESFRDILENIHAWALPSEIPPEFICHGALIRIFYKISPSDFVARFSSFTVEG